MAEPTWARDRENQWMKGEGAVLVTNIERLKYPENNEKKYVSPRKLKGKGDVKNGISSEYINNKKEVFNIFVSKWTKEILPRHFREYPSYNIIVQGRPSAGKTIDLMQKMVDIPNILARENDKIEFFQDSLEQAVPNGIKENKKRYLNGYLPEPNPDTGLQSIYFCYKYAGKGILLNLIDVPGEAEPTVKEKLFLFADTIWFYIDGECLEDSVKMEETKSRLLEIVGQLGDKAKQIKVSIIVTKADACWSNKENTLVKDLNGATYLGTHSCSDGGYKLDVHKSRCKEVEELLTLKQPSLIQMLNNSFGEVAYFAIANTNCACNEKDNKIPANAEMFRVEEPLLYLLTQLKLYPYVIARDQEKNNILNGKVGESIGKFLQILKS